MGCIGGATSKSVQRPLSLEANEKRGITSPALICRARRVVKGWVCGVLASHCCGSPGAQPESQMHCLLSVRCQLQLVAYFRMGAVSTLQQQ